MITYRQFIWKYPGSRDEIITCKYINDNLREVFRKTDNGILWTSEMSLYHWKLLLKKSEEVPVDYLTLFIDLL